MALYIIWNKLVDPSMNCDSIYFSSHCFSITQLKLLNQIYGISAADGAR